MRWLPAVSFIFQSTLPGWGATHAPRRRQPQLLISIHAPRMGSDPAFIIFLPKFKIFQSTLPGWGATGAGCRGEMAVRISIHAPRMGSDSGIISNWPMMRGFQSTLPGWGATRHGNVEHHRQVISIHAPRMGSDRKGNRLRSRHSKFQSTLPGWGATGVLFEHIQAHNHFNPRSPDGERHAAACPHAHGRDFNPRSPDGERLVRWNLIQMHLIISIHAPRMGSDRENGHLRPRYGQNHPFSTLIVSQIVVDVLGTVRKSQKHQRTSHYEVIKQPERQK